MSCSNCFSNYNFFFREHGCPVCHMSLCSKCLPEKLPIDGKKQSVCRKCYNKATTIEDEAPPLLPPEALKRRLEDLENPARPPITVYRQSSRAASLKHGLSRQDSELVDRLEALKADRKTKHVPTESEMAARLAALKGEPPNTRRGSGGPSGYLPAADRRSAAQQEHDFIEQSRDQLAMEARYRPEEGLQERLARLRGCESGPGPAPEGHPAGRHGQPQLPVSTDDQTPADLVAAVSAEVAAEVERANQIAQKVADIHHRLEEVKGLARDGRRGGPATTSGPAAPAHGDTADPSEEQEVQRLIKQMTEQAALEDREMDAELESLSSAGEEELPWCCICNVDAAVRCGGCSGDLYCRSCFREGHDEGELRHHQWTPFPDPK